jgi:argininosuccinate synthase
MKKLVLAYSGGLDTSYCAKSLSLAGYEVHAVTVNTGGFAPEEIAEIERKALAMGVHSYTAIDSVRRFYTKVVRYLIFGNVLKNNTYPLSVSAERVVQALEIVQYAQKIGATHIAHGSTGAGNDQVRFDLIFRIITPDMKLITPIRDEALSRETEIAYLQAQGVEGQWEKAKYSINKGLWGTSVGGVETLTSDRPLPEHAYPTQQTENTPRTLRLGFKAGELVSIDGRVDAPQVLIQDLERIAGPYGIGRDIHVGDTIIGIKGRVGFEAAAALLTIKAHHLLEKHTLSKWQQFQKEQIGNFYGMLLHEGQYLDPVMRNLEAFLIDSQKAVKGTVIVTLHPYRFTLDGVDSPNDLMRSSFGSYGEENKAWTAEDAKGFIAMSANAGMIYNSIHPYHD